MKVETKIVMKVGGKTLEMTPEEARQLRDELDMVVGRQRPHYVPYLPWVPIAPYNPTWTVTSTSVCPTAKDTFTGAQWIIDYDRPTYGVQ